MSVAQIATLLGAVAGVITAVVALLRQVQTGKQLQQHMQAHAQQRRTPAPPGPTP